MCQAYDKSRTEKNMSLPNGNNTMKEETGPVSVPLFYTIICITMCFGTRTAHKVGKNRVDKLQKKNFKRDSIDNDL